MLQNHVPWVQVLVPLLNENSTATAVLFSLRCVSEMKPGHVERAMGRVARGPRETCFAGWLTERRLRRKQRGISGCSGRKRRG